MTTSAKIRLAIAYLNVTKSSKPWPSALANCSLVTNSGKRNIPIEKKKPITQVIVNVNLKFKFLASFEEVRSACFTHDYHKLEWEAQGEILHPFHEYP